MKERLNPMKSKNSSHNSFEDLQGCFLLTGICGSPQPCRVLLISSHPLKHIIFLRGKKTLIYEKGGVKDSRWHQSSLYPIKVGILHQTNNVRVETYTTLVQVEL